MKILFPKQSSGAFLTSQQGTPRIISFAIICFFVGLCASYLLEKNLWLLAIAVLGIAGILVGGAVIGFRNWKKVELTRSAPIKKHAPRIISEWDYQPRKAIRRYAAANGAGAKTSEVLSPEPFAINNNVWLDNDSLERAGYTFINLDPRVEEPTAKAPLSNHEVRSRRTTKVL